MRRGIVINLSWAGLLFFLLTTLSALFPKTPDMGGVYYFDENGRLLWYATGDTARCYVVKTTKIPEEVYGRLDSVDARLKDGSPYQAAKINSISRELYDSVVNHIRNGWINTAVVQENIVEIESPAVFREIIKRIPDDGRGDTCLNNNREYGGMIQRNNSVAKIDTGSRSYPCFGGAGVSIYGRGKAEFHSHPSGTQFLRSAGCGFIQPPSKDDQETVGKRRGYVLGMASKLVYMYDSTGINAVLPFSWFKAP